MQTLDVPAHALDETQTGNRMALTEPSFGGLGDDSVNEHELSKRMMWSLWAPKFASLATLWEAGTTCLAWLTRRAMRSMRGHN